MRRFFAKNLLFVLSINFFVKTIWVFMIDRTVQNRVGHASYGTYQALLSLCIIFQTLDLAITNYNINTVSQSPDKLRKLFPSMLSTKLLMMCIYALFIFSLGLFAGYSGGEFKLLGGLFIIQSLSSLMVYVRSNIAALQHFKKDSVLSISDKLLMIVICGFLLYAPLTASQFKIEWFIICQIVCYTIAVIFSFFVLYRTSGMLPHFSWNISETHSIIKQSLPYTLLIFLMGIYTRTDAILIERLCGAAGKTQTGIYAAGFRLLDVSNNMLGILFAGILLPMFGKMLAEKQNVQPVIKLSVNILLPVSFTIAVAAFFFGADIMHLLYHNTTNYDGRVLSWLMASFPAFCMIYIYHTLLTANKNLGLLNIISIAAVAINISLNLYIIPRYNAEGAAVIAFITQSIVALSCILLAGKVMKLPFNIKWIAAHFGFMLFAIATGYLLLTLSISWLVQLFLLGSICLCAMFVFRFISARAITELLNRKNAS
jgi:O-antigen/teichoic acid export membrane protein